MPQTARLLPIPGQSSQLTMIDDLNSARADELEFCLTLTWSPSVQLARSVREDH